MTQQPLPYGTRVLVQCPDGHRLDGVALGVSADGLDVQVLPDGAPADSGPVWLPALWVHVR